MGPAAGIAARLGVEVVGETIEGIFGLASATVTAAGEAAKGIGSAVGGALQGAFSPAPVTVVNNVGMVGEAAKSKVTGGGTIPAAPKKSAKPAANVNMPTEKLLVIAVNYLSSIEKTLAAQLNFERTAAAQQATAEREAAIEGESAQATSPFKSLGEKLGAIKNDAVGRAGMMTKLALGGAALAGFGLLGLGEMDTAELDRLKSNWEKFQEQWQWLTDIIKPVAEHASWGTFLGYMLFGARGAVAGWLFDYIKDVTGGSDVAAWTAGATAATALGVFGSAARTALFTTPLGGAALATGATFAATEAAFTSTQTDEQNKKTAFFEKYKLFVEEWSENGSLYVKKYRIYWPERNINIRGIKQSELVANDRKSDRYYYWNRVLDASTIRDRSAQLSQAWLDSEDAQAWLNERYPLASDASLVPQASTTPDAAPASSSSGADAASVSSTGEPLPPAAAGSIDAILDKNPENLTDAELRQLVEAQGRIEDPNGKTNNPGGILYGTGPLQEHQIGSVGANADSSVKIAVYDTPENGIRAAMENWRNSRYYRGKSVREGLGTWSGGNGAHYAKMLGSARPGYEGTNNPQVSSEGSGGLMSGLWNLGEGAMEAIGNILKTAIDTKNMTTVALGSQMSGTTTASSSDMPQATSAGGGAASPITPETNTTTKALTDISTQLQNSVDLGLAEKTQTNIAQESTGQMSIRNANASNDGKLECLDPNFPGSGGVEAYLQYYRMAA